jgi:hypothetical protein
MNILLPFLKLPQGTYYSCLAIQDHSHIFLSHLKCVSAEGSPEGLPAWPACLDDSSTMFNTTGLRADSSFLQAPAVVSGKVQSGGGWPASQPAPTHASSYWLRLVNTGRHNGPSNHLAALRCEPRLLCRSRVALELDASEGACRLRRVHMYIQKHPVSTPVAAERSWVGRLYRGRNL